MEKILIIDDEAFIRENVSRILSEEGYQVDSDRWKAPWMPLKRTSSVRPGKNTG